MVRIEATDYREKEHILKELERRLVQEGIVTHFGDDLDNRFAAEALRINFHLDELKVDRTPAGQPISGRINIDVGDPTCTDPITYREDGTIIIDHHFNDHPNTLSILSKVLGIYVPEQAIELADQAGEQVTPLEWRTPISLARHLPVEKLWELAEKRLLTEAMTDEQLRAHGLYEVAQKQKEIIENAKAAVINGSVPGTKATIVDTFVPAGSQVAYSLGYDVYVSISQHPKGGCTFAATAKPGTALPEGVLALGHKLREEHGNDIFIRPDGAMIVAGGPKNPDFSLPYSSDEMKSLITEAIQPLKVETKEAVTSEDDAEAVIDHLVEKKSGRIHRAFHV